MSSSTKKNKQKKKKEKLNKSNKAADKKPPIKSDDMGKKVDKTEAEMLESGYEFSQESSEALDSVKNNKENIPSNAKAEIASILDQCCKLLEDVKKFKLQTEKNRTKSTEELKEAKNKLESIQKQEEELNVYSDESGH